MRRNCISREMAKAFVVVAATTTTATTTTTNAAAIIPKLPNSLPQDPAGRLPEAVRRVRVRPWRLLRHLWSVPHGDGPPREKAEGGGGGHGRVEEEVRVKLRAGQEDERRRRRQGEGAGGGKVSGSRKWPILIRQLISDVFFLQEKGFCHGEAEQGFAGGEDGPHQ